MAERGMVTERSAEAPGQPAASSWLDAVVEQWHTACHDGEAGSGESFGAQPFREAEAAVLVRAISAGLAGNHGRALEAAAEAWARSVRSLPVMGARFACLRRVLEDLCDEGLQAKLDKVLDLVSTVATQTALADLEDAALTDSLTGAGNRRALERAAVVAMAEASRTGNLLSVAVIDLDGLKLVNDTQGHVAGDDALGRLADAIRRSCRATDQLFRIGGDEFVVLLPLAGEAAVAELMGRAMGGGAPRFSWGCAGFPGDGTDLESLLASADARLYAKRRAAGYGDGRAVRTVASGAAPGRPASTHRHFGRAAIAAIVSVAAVAVIAVLVGTGGKTPHPVDNFVPGPGSHPASGAPPDGATAGLAPGGGSGSGSSSGSGSGSGSGSSGGAGAGAGGAPGSGTTGAPGSSGSTNTSGPGSTTPPGSTPNTTLPVSTPPTTVPNISGGGSLLPPTTVPATTIPSTPTTTVPSGGLLGGVGSGLLSNGSTGGSGSGSGGVVGGLLG